MTEVGYVRIVTNPASGPIVRSAPQAAALLDDLARHPGYRRWRIADSWTTLTAPFATRISGHKHVTDACLLGLAIKEDGVLVTFDRGLRYLAGAEFARNLLVLEGRSGG